MSLIRAPEFEAREQLRFYIENASLFWMGMVLAHASRARFRLRSYARDICKAQGIPFHIHCPEPDQLVELSIQLALEAPRGLHWICTERWLGLQSPEYLWERANTHMLLAMNERRDAYIHHLEGGIVLEGKPYLKTQIRDWAPDLFSICAFVAEPSGPELIPETEQSIVPPELPPFPTEFVGRADELERIASFFHGETQRPAFALCGPSGTGKSYLSAEYAKRRAKDYPGGIFYLNAGSLPPSDLASVGERVGEVYTEGESVLDYDHRVLDSLIDKRVLLIYDNAEETGPALLEWLPPGDAEWHLLITTTRAGEQISKDIGTCEVGPLKGEDARALVAQVLRVPGAIERWADTLIAKAGGITLELCAMAKEVERAVVAGREVEFFGAPTAEMESSLLGPWLGLSEDARYVLGVIALFEAWALPVGEVWAVLSGQGWERKRLDRALDMACDRMLVVVGEGRIRMHPLVRAFVRGRVEVEEGVKLRMLERYAEAAEAYAEHPTDKDVERRFEAYPADIKVWEAMGGDVAGKMQHYAEKIGVGLQRITAYDFAIPWFECALNSLRQASSPMRGGNESEAVVLGNLGFCHMNISNYPMAIEFFRRAINNLTRGDPKKIDHNNLAACYYNIADCYQRQGYSEDAHEFLKECLKIVRKGDKRSRIHHTNVGCALQAMGSHCLQHGFDERGLRYLEEAVREIRKGDEKKRIDYSRLGDALDSIGWAYFVQHNFDRARHWIDKALKAYNKGDVYGRIDHERLGDALSHLARCHFEEGNLLQARHFFERAIETYIKGDHRRGVNETKLSTCRSALADILEQLHPSPIKP